MGGSKPLGDILAALLAVGMISLAMIAAFVLAMLNGPSATPTHSTTVHFTASPTSASIVIFETDTPMEPSPYVTSNITSGPPPTPTPTCTHTPRPSTSTHTPSPTHTPTPTVTPSPITPSSEPTTCGPPSGWVTYTVQPGENLFRIGLRYGLTVAELRLANCLESDTIYAGQRLYVPYAIPTNQPAQPWIWPTSIGNSCPASPSCRNPQVMITSPTPGQVLSGPFQVFGTANIENFGRYKLEYRVDGRPDYITIREYYQPVEDGLLGEIDPRPIGSGVYWIRLVVVDRMNGVPLEPCAIRVCFDIR